MMKINPRSAWGAKRAKSVTRVAQSKRTGFMAHYTTGEELARDRAETAGWIRDIQAFHQNQRGWADIGYNFLIDRFGQVWEGRGWDRLGAHATGANTACIGVAFLGDDDPGQDVPPVARQAFHDLYTAANKRFGRTLEPLGHRDAGSTACPGNEIYGLVRAGFPAPGGSTPAPAPAPKPSTGTLKRGSKGQRVRNLQQGLNAVFPLYSRLAVDGSFGPKTEAVVREFQSRAGGLAVDGKVGPATTAALARYGVRF